MSAIWSSEKSFFALAGVFQNSWYLRYYPLSNTVRVLIVSAVALLLGVMPTFAVRLVTHRTPLTSRMICPVNRNVYSSCAHIENCIIYTNAYIFLDFQSTKRGFPLVDSWSGGMALTKFNVSQSEYKDRDSTAIRDESM